MPAGAAGDAAVGGGEDSEADAVQPMTKEHAAAFKRVMEKRRVIWSDYAAAFQARPPSPSAPSGSARPARPL
jgi:hypothetical protein